MKKIFLTIIIFYIFYWNLSCNPGSADSIKGWDQVPAILSRIKAPRFNDQEYNIVKYGAKGDGVFDCTEAFKIAIDACHQKGGGRVVVPAGNYLTGAIHLKSNVNLHISDGATVLFSTDTRKYLPVVFTRFEGIECFNYSPFIYAYEQENIAITGKGILDGQAGIENWWIWKGQQAHGWENGKLNGISDTEKLYQMPEEGIPVSERVFGEGYYLRTNFIQPYKCRNVLIEGVTIKRSPMWVIHPVLCDNVIVQNVTVISHGPNNDGCNPESSKNVWINGCYFDTGDDCIAIKSGRNADGRRVDVSSENIIIQNCTMREGHGAVVIGSEMSGNVRNIFIEDCVMDSPNLERALRFKTNSMRGGIAENIYMRNCTIGQVSDAVVKVDFRYGEGDSGQHTPIIRNVYISDIQSEKSNYAFYLEGYERSPVSNFFVNNCRFNGVDKGNFLKFVNNINLNQVYMNGEILQIATN